MPTLNWIGKESVINHHHDVPFRTLEQKYTFGEGTDGNKIIHGDNLEALKSLLPEYEGRIKCIYIDPPYNTGNENWVYNDNVNSPKIRKWLGQVVGKEAEDLTRHDKWLCMMYPRLKLLQRLLSDDGAIFISIDDNEQANLKLICDEIFGERNFMAQFSVIVKTEGRRYGGVAKTHEYTLVYANNMENIVFNEIEIEGKKFQFVDDLGGFNLQELRNQNARAFNSSNRPNLRYPFYVKLNEPDHNGLCQVFLENHDGLTEVYPITVNGYESVWRWGKNEKATRQLSDLVARKGTDGVVRIYQKMRKLTEAPKTVLIDKDYLSIKGTKEIQEIMGSSSFDFPKPLKLINLFIHLASDKSSIILDSFAGSGTTAHAVLNLNKQDGGNRKFILVEMEDYAENITAERVRRVINGYGEDKNAVEGTGGSFSFYELGEPVFDEDGYMNEKIGREKLCEYIWYTETRTPYATAIQPNKYLLGIHQDTSYYFYYEPEKITTLSHDTLNIISEKAETYVVYADQCVIDKEWLSAHNIIFKKIPRDISRF